LFKYKNNVVCTIFQIHALRILIIILLNKFSHRWNVNCLVVSKTKHVVSNENTAVIVYNFQHTATIFTLLYFQNDLQLFGK